MSKRDQSNKGLSNYCDTASNQCGQTGLSLRKDAESAATGSTVAFVAGGVALGAGIILFVTAPRAAVQTGLTIAPAPIAGGGGATLRATF
jgi:hypothetical protein